MTNNLLKGLIPTYPGAQCYISTFSSISDVQPAYPLQLWIYAYHGSTFKSSINTLRQRCVYISDAWVVVHRSFQGKPTPSAVFRRNGIGEASHWPQKVLPTTLPDLCFGPIYRPRASVLPRHVILHPTNSKDFTEFVRSWSELFTFLPLGAQQNHASEVKLALVGQGRPGNSGLLLRPSFTEILKYNSSLIYTVYS